MNPLAFLPLLACACMAAPGNIALAGNPLVLNSGLSYASIQVPLTKTVHYENRPVVTGYSTSIIKPSIVQQTVAAPLLAPVAVQGSWNLNLLRQQLPSPPEAPAFPSYPPPGGNSSADNPNQYPTLPPPPPPPAAPEAPQYPSQPPNNTADQPGGFPAPPAFPAPPSLPGQEPTTQAPPATTQAPEYRYIQSLNLQPFLQLAQPQIVAQAAPAQIVQNDAVVVEARSNLVQPQLVQQQLVRAAVPVQQVAVRQAQAADYEPLVTQQRVLAPVRQHTQITPQVTQIQPQVVTRQVVHDVPVQTPVAVQTPVITRTVGLQQVGVQHLGVQQLGVQQLGLQQLGVQQLGVQQAGLLRSGLVSNGAILNGGLIQNGLGLNQYVY